jgi:ornithine cyclodeaminase/alanine dehydrogenase-like protein (mu-crystallin family)
MTMFDAAKPIDLNKRQIEAIFDLELAHDRIRSAFIADFQGRIQTAAVGHLHFPQVNGDVHIKSGHIDGSESYVIKVASSFFGNPLNGLSSSNGLMILCSARDGTWTALLRDEGWLTDMRTAISGALVSLTLARHDARSVTIVGAGIQARLQAWCLHKLAPGRQFHFQIWARNAAEAEASAATLAASGIDARPALDLSATLPVAEIVITTTPSREPLFKAAMITPGTHILAVGADARGKQELPVDLVLGADLRVCDLSVQSLDHGEFQHAALVDPALEVVEIGAILAAAHPGRQRADEITVADLTGSAAQDHAIAQAILDAARAETNNGKWA